MNPKITALGLSAVLLAFCGCRTESGRFASRSDAELDLMESTNELQNAAFCRGDYRMAEALLSRLAADQTVSSSQYDLEKASILLVQGRKDEAHELLMKARTAIEQVIDAESEEKATSIWHGENSKVFKGDAHERATLYALLAISFMDRGEYEDAIRCVKNGLLADSANTKEVQYNSDYALLQYLGYVAASKSGDDAEATSYAKEMAKNLADRKIPIGKGSAARAFFEKENIPDAFLVVWTGLPPTYVRGGEYEEIRYVAPGDTLVDFLTMETEGGQERIMAKGLGDVNFQATTRGGREMDEVLADKAAVKSGFKTSGNILIVAGLACVTTVSDNWIAELAILGAGGTCLALGGTCHLVGYCVNSKADVRSWRNLPGEFVIVPVKLSGASQELTVRGYRVWDNIATEKCTVMRSEKGIGVTHLSMLPSEWRGRNVWGRDFKESRKEAK